MSQHKLPNRPEGLFLSLALLWLVYLLYKLPNRPDGLLASGAFMVCSIANHRIGQTDSLPLWHFVGSTICNQLVLSGDHRYRLYNTKVLGGVWTTRLVGLIYWYYSDSYFKAMGGQGPVGMITRLTNIIWCWCNEVDRRETRNEARKVGGWSWQVTCGPGEG